MSWFLAEERRLYSLSEFQDEYERKVITEWLSAYINYECIQDYLQFAYD